MKMKFSFLWSCLAAMTISPPLFSQRLETWNDQVFKIDTLASGLSYPWEITYGPDDSLWVTETRGYRIKKIHPGNRGVGTLINLSSYANFDMNTVSNRPQGGLMGLAIHPQFLSGKPYVYVAMVYYKLPSTGSPNNSRCSGTTGNHPCYYKTKILRFTYDFSTGKLNGSPDVVMDNLFGSNDHNSGRLTIGPDLKLYYSIGDMGAGQFNNQTRTNNAQNTDVYEGKILRLNTEPDGDAFDAADRYNLWIPNDNPFVHSTSGKRLAIYSYGHRNAQGLVWANVSGTDRLFSSEHGDKSDDEVNIIEAGRNYGWPKVAGLCDNNYSTNDSYGNNDRLANQLVGYEDTFCTNHNVHMPMFGLLTASAAAIPADGSNIFTWPTIAPSSIDFYKGTFIPGWHNSLLVTSLKYGMFRLKLASSGDRVDSSSTPAIIDTIPYFHGYRVRDVAIAPTGDTLFLAIDSSGNTSGPTGGFGTNVAISTKEGGNILRVVYLVSLSAHQGSRLFPHQDKGQISIYPNPASGYLNIGTGKEVSKPFTMGLFDIAGRRLVSRIIHQDQFTMDIHGFKAGVYIVRIYDGIGAVIAIEKVVIR